MLFSIVVPIYNAESTIYKCINSLVNQKFDDFEIILVDDGSSDDTFNKCLKYSKDYSNIKVINQENNGVGSARNKGIDYADGDYILFIDSDDYIEKNALSIYQNIVKLNNPDIIISGYRQTKIDTKAERIYSYSKKWFGSLNEFIKIHFEELFDNWLIHSPWNKLFKRDIILKNNIRFSQNYSIYEDIGFVLDYLISSESICIIPDVLYNYNVKEQGSLVTKFHENAYIAYLDCWIRLKDLMFNSGVVNDKLYNKLQVFICNKIFGYLKELYRIRAKNIYNHRKLIISEICSNDNFSDLIHGLKLKKIHQKAELFLMKHSRIQSMNFLLSLIYRCSK